MPKPQPAKAALLVVFAGLTLAALGHSVWRALVGSSPVGSAPASAPPPPAAVPVAVASARPEPPPVAHAAGRGEAWAKFKERFGGDLQARFESDGTVSMIQGAPGAGTRAGPDFRPDDPQKAIARAREVLDAAKDLLGVQQDAPLDSPIAKSGAVSAQVFFRESKEGVPVAPFGSVKVDLGPQGELLGLSSDYVRDVQVGNEPRLDPEQAKAKAAAAIADGDAHPEGGDHVLWVKRSLGSSATGIHAYEYVVHGRQVVVDASSGEIIARRDRRTY